MERLHKVIANSGLTSRRAAEELIVAGKVTVNGSLVTTLGVLVNPDSDTILVDNKPLPQTGTVTYLLYKPAGFVCSTVKQGSAPIVTSLVPGTPPVYPVGRLDKESEGLILLTNDGLLANRLMHPSFGHTKTYQVTCVPEEAESIKDPTRIISALIKGVKLGDGIAKASQSTIESAPNNTLILTITVHEGRHHLIRRMCAVVGLRVLKLVRTEISGVVNPHFKPGQYRLLQSEELTGL